MSAGLAVFDVSVQESDEWLEAIRQLLRPCGRRQAYVARGAVLHVQRDRLQSEAVLGLSTQAWTLLACLSKACGPPAALRASAICSNSWRL